MIVVLLYCSLEEVLSQNIDETMHFVFDGVEYVIDEDGIAKSWYVDSTLKSVGMFTVKQGLFVKSKMLQDGLWVYYTIEGQLQKLGIYEDGLKNGLWISYSKQGKVLRTELYKNDSLVGSATSTTIR